MIMFIEFFLLSMMGGVIWRLLEVEKKLVAQTDLFRELLGTTLKQAEKANIILDARPDKTRCKKGSKEHRALLSKKAKERWKRKKEARMKIPPQVALIKDYEEDQAIAGAADP